MATLLHYSFSGVFTFSALEDISTGLCDIPMALLPFYLYVVCKISVCIIASLCINLVYYTCMTKRTQSFVLPTYSAPWHAWLWRHACA